MASIISTVSALGHCSRAFRRSKLWQSAYLPKDKVPSLAELMSGHLQLDEDTTNMLEAAIEDDAQNNMYWGLGTSSVSVFPGY